LYNGVRHFSKIQGTRKKVRTISGKNQPRGGNWVGGDRRNSIRKVRGEVKTASNKGKIFNLSALIGVKIA